MQTRNLTLTEPTSNKDICQNRQFIDRYEAVVENPRLSWASNLSVKKVIGKGGQGTVFLAERTGSDNFCLPVAVKVFSPEPYSNPTDYDTDMSRIGHIASQVARIQHENLIDVHHFLVRERVRIMIMEWIEGFDLRKLMTPRMYGLLKDRVSQKRWEKFQIDIVTPGSEQPRLKIPPTLSILRDCLESLKSLHQECIVHADIKPSNIMLNRSGRAKIIDIGLARGDESELTFNACTPAYAAPTVLAGEPPSPATDLISLGYVVLELLSGKPVFRKVGDLDQLMQEKLQMGNRIQQFVHDDSHDANLAIELCSRLIKTDNDASNTCESCLQLLKNHWPIDDQNLLGIWIEELLDTDDVSSSET